jgi:serine/threonine protein phosphatase PrpC
MSLWNDDTLEIQVSDLFSSLIPQPFSSLVRVEFGAVSDRGKVRSNNEDSYLIYRTGRYWEHFQTSLSPEQLPDRFEENGYVMAVADGMGGHKAGQVASSLALRVGVATILNAARWGLKLDNLPDREQEIKTVVDQCLEMVRQIHAVVTEEARRDPTLAGMGTTLTASYSVGDDLFVLHIGDSRAYLFRDSQLQQITHDHTLVQQMIDSGEISPQDAARHRLRHVLTRAIGSNSEVEAEVSHLTLRDGDRILLCSDGLTGMVPDSLIATTLADVSCVQRACEQLVQLALDAGGKDNVTVLLAHYQIPQRPQPLIPNTRKK